MIFANSRYTDAELYVADDGKIAIDPRSTNEAQDFEFARYRVKDSDRVDLLADRFLHDARSWWVLSRANPENLYPVPEPGQRIRIPDASL